jgi:membrane protein implicated in regulation of membrane protease activity
MHFLEWPALGWLALAILAAFVEVSTPHFGSLFVSAAAVASAVVAALGGDAEVQVVTLAFVIVGGLSILRPRLASRLRLQSRGVPSRTDTLIGRDAMVTHDIDGTLGTGRVNVGGQDWAARSSAAIPAGTLVKVVSADGIVLEVTRV